MSILQHASIVELSHRARADTDLARGTLLTFMLPTFQRFYPGFETWYRQKVIPGFLSGERTIFVAMGDGIDGVSIVKQPHSSGGRAKLCSFYVAMKARGVGLGTHLLDQTTELLDAREVASTLVTVPEEAFEGEEGAKFCSLLRQANFKPMDKMMGRYRLGKIEYLLERRNRS